MSRSDIKFPRTPYLQYLLGGGGEVEGGGALKTCAINYTTYLKKQTQTSNA